MKYTAKPWIWDREKGIVHNGKVTICVLSSLHNWKPIKEEELESNAHLIEAAPNMYEALILTDKELDRMKVSGASDWPIRAIVKQALRKVQRGL